MLRCPVDRSGRPRTPSADVVDLRTLPPVIRTLVEEVLAHARSFASPPGRAGDGSLTSEAALRVVKAALRVVLHDLTGAPSPGPTADPPPGEAGSLPAVTRIAVDEAVWKLRVLRRTINSRWRG